MKKLILFLTIFISHQPFAATNSIVGGGVSPITQYPYEGSIYGLRFNPGWGSHEKVYGLDMSLIGGITSKAFAGAAVAGFFNTNLSTANIIGFQIAGLGNFNLGKTRVYGIQFGNILNVNSGQAFIYGLQASIFANLGKNYVKGIQIGVYNRAEIVKGLQIGVINSAGSLHGIQIGLLNFHNKGAIPFFPGINIGF